MSEQLLDEINDYIYEPKWNQWVNPRLREELKKRFVLLQTANKSPVLQKAILEACKKDPVLWINDWVFTADPRNLAEGKPVQIPFLLFKRQEEYIEWRRERVAKKENGIVEKSRDSGMSWINIADQAHRFVFDNNFKGSFGSRKEDLIDKKGDPDSLFHKLRFLLRNLPDWMLLEDDWSTSHLKCINTKNGSTIVGEAGENIGRGGRSLIFDCDEAAFIPRFDVAFRALAGNTNSLILTSTPNGTANKFYELRASEKYSIFTFSWRHDPRKDDAWYAEQCSKYDDVTVAQEIDIDYSASLENALIPAKWVIAAVDYFPQSRDVTKGVLQAGLDVAAGGKNDSVFMIFQAPIVWAHTIKSWNGLDPVESAFKSAEFCLHWKPYSMTVDADGVGEGTIGGLKLLEGFETHINVFHGNARPSNLYWTQEKVYSHQKFKNKRAEAWYLLRDRFRKTYYTKMGIQIFPDDELISIPNDTKLIQQLSSVKGQRTAEGKLKVESKEDLLERGIASPDRADALVYAHYPVGSNGVFLNGQAIYG